MEEQILTSYNVKTKTKGRPIKDAVISKTVKGAFMVSGTDPDTGDKLTTLCNGEKALAAVKAGQAKFADEKWQAELEDKYSAKPDETKEVE